MSVQHPKASALPERQTKTEDLSPVSYLPETPAELQPAGRQPSSPPSTRCRVISAASLSVIRFCAGCLRD